jgi:hypothetical protein
MWGPYRGGGDSPPERAQELMYEAFEEPDPGRRTELARRALAVCPDCAAKGSATRG